MPQTTETGRAGNRKGYQQADEIGSILEARRMSNVSNIFQKGSQTLLIKTGSAAIAMRSTLDQVSAVIFGIRLGDGWALYRLEPAVFEDLSVPSRSRSHDENYRQVSAFKIKFRGSLIYENNRFLGEYLW